MKLVTIILFTSLSLNSTFCAEIKCYGDTLNLEALQKYEVDVLEALYSNNTNQNYKGRLCGVEDTANICFIGDNEEASYLLENYYKYSYQYDDEINAFYVKSLAKNKHSIRLHYREQWSSYEFDIERCEGH